jgi:Circadian oscillating protein COP23
MVQHVGDSIDERLTAHRKIMKTYLPSVGSAFLLFTSLFTLACNIQSSGAASSQSDALNIFPRSQLVSINEPALTDKIQLTCGSSYNARLKKNVPTTIAQKGSEKRAIAQWVKPMGEYWTPERRCQQVSQGMQAANTVGNLKYITNGKMNGQRVICTETEPAGDCNNLLMALRAEDKPLKFLGEIQVLFNGYYYYSFVCTGYSSGEPQIEYTIDLDRLWENAPKA